MKKLGLIFLTLVLIGFCSCSAPKTLLDMTTAYENREFYTSGGFQDFTDYAKYTYDSIDVRELELSACFEKVTDDDISNILSYVRNFEKWVKNCGGELEENYDFKKTVISSEDFFYIATREGDARGDDKKFGKFDLYSLYYFDVDAKILYYFHVNN